jgi:serine/threonine protein kinase
MHPGTARESAGATPASFQPGQVLDGRFRIVAPLGRGGFGEVFRAEELLPNGATIREVALKLLSPESDVDAWASEATLLGSFSHPALVTILAAGLLDVGASPGPGEARSPRPVPFVAMELLDGETLADLQGRGPVPWRRALAWARDVAAALDVIHERGVVHLDLKPSNLFLTRDGRIKVLDFGIARRAGALASGHAGSPPIASEDAAICTEQFLAERGSGPLSASRGAGALAPPRTPAPEPIVGTPGFMAPEVIEERPATAAADAYALAACFVHLATGRLPQDAPPAAAKNSSAEEQKAWRVEVRLATSAGRLRDLAAAGLPRGVASLCERLLTLDPAARGVSPGGMRALWDAAWERPFGVPDPPYLGLGTFGLAAEGMLFGRDDDVARLGRDLVDAPVLVLHGVSGSGKSSLAMAGLVPHLARRDVARGLDARAVVVRPGVDPDMALARALSALGEGEGLGFATIDELSRYAGEAGLGVALVFDQLEELCTQAAPASRERFLAFLAGAAALPPGSQVRVVCTLREDFTSTLLAIEPLGELLRDTLRFVGPPTMAAARAIVAEPARLAGVRIERLGEVATDIERELRAGEGRLPLCALALAAFWETRKGGVLHVDEWTKLGGVRAIFADLADGVYAGLDEAAQIEARAALLALSSEGRTRRSLSRAALRAGSARPLAFDRALSAFIAAKLLVESGGAIEVVHEFLFTAWDRLENWLADAQASRRLAAALLEGARAWQELERPATRLPGGSEVALSALVLTEGVLLGAEAELLGEWLGAARARDRRERVRFAALAALGLSVLLLVLAAWGQTISNAQALAEDRKRAADQAAAAAHENELRAVLAQQAAERAIAEAARSRVDRERAADFVRRQQESFDQAIRTAESELKKARIRCNVLEQKERLGASVCPPWDPLCASNNSGVARQPPLPEVHQKVEER